MAGGPDPSDAEVSAFYRQNQARYMIPERRVLRYAVFGAEQVAAAATPTEAEIANFYRSNAARYGAKETRTLSWVVLPDQAAARALAAKIAGGTSFADAARQAGFGPADTAIGQKSREEIVNIASAAVATAAFSTPQGKTTPPVQSPLGWHVVKVDAVNVVAARPLAAVRAEIAKQVGTAKAQDALTAMVTRIEDKLGEGSSLEEVARAEKLNVQETPPVTATGQQPGVAGWKAPPELAPLLRGGFEMGPDEDPAVETITPNQRFAMLAVGRVVPAAPPALAQIRDQVKTDLIARRAADRARQLAKSLVDKINRGTPPRAAFAQAGVKLPALQAVTARRIDIAKPNQPVPPPLAMMFTLPKGRAKLLEAPNGAGWFVVHLENSVPGNAAAAPALVQATRTQFQQILGDEYAAQFSAAVQRQLKVKRNEDAIARTRRQLLGGAPVQ
jgi:peptidyl-prolyl cis-trans isomerase D